MESLSVSFVSCISYQDGTTQEDAVFPLLFFLLEERGYNFLTHSKFMTRLESQILFNRFCEFLIQ